jgi:hypothetical protein
MHDSIIPGPDDSRPSISSPLASQAVRLPRVHVESLNARTNVVVEGSTPPNTSVSTSSTVDEEILQVSAVTVNQDGALKARGDTGSVEEREVVELTH